MAFKDIDVKDAAKQFFNAAKKPLLIAGITFILTIISFNSCFVCNYSAAKWLALTAT